MQIDDFLKNISNNAPSSVFCFSSDEYPLIFFMSLFDLLHTNSGLPASFKKINIDSKNMASFYPLLQQSFLGQNNFYWFGDLSQSLSSKKLSDVLVFLSNYKGPHFVAFFLTKDVKLKSKLSKKIKIIDIENNVNKDDFLKLLNLFKVRLSQQKLDIICNDIFFNTTYSLDESCMLIFYFEVLNIRYIKKNNDYLSLIWGSKSSLYMLSDAFFAMGERTFFSLWQEIGPNYPDMFWISFWSNQIFKAYYVIKFLNQKDFTKAKRMSFRLPYNFIKRDYKRFSLDKLTNSYEFLFNIDFAIKKGSSFCSLDLFYLNHFVDS